MKDTTEVCFAFEHDGPNTQIRCVVTGFGDNGGTVTINTDDTGALLDFMKNGGDPMAETVHKLERDAAQWQNEGKPANFEAQP